MKNLLNAIKTQLQTDLTYIRDGDIYVTEDENLIPESARFPALGIKDGPVTRIELPSEMQEVTLTVILTPFVQLDKPEAAIMGDSHTGKKGVLDITGDIHRSLDENLLGITGMQTAFSPREEGSELFGDEKEVIQKKTIIYQYVKEEERP